MIYVVVTLLVLALLFDFSVWRWLKANPVPPLVEIPDWRVRRYTPPSTNYHQAIHGAMAVSSWAVIPNPPDPGVSSQTASHGPW